VDDLLASYRELLEGSRRLTDLGDRLLARGVTGFLLTDREASDARRELDAARQAIERLDGFRVRA
jgi:hypothetical protein